MASLTSPSLTQRVSPCCWAKAMARFRLRSATAREVIHSRRQSVTSTVTACLTWAWPTPTRRTYLCCWVTGTGLFEPPSTTVWGRVPGRVAITLTVGDFNGDTKPDLAVANDF